MMHSVNIGDIGKKMGRDGIDGWITAVYHSWPRHLPLAGVETNKLYEELMDKLESTQPDDASMGAVIDTLKKTHDTSAELEAFWAWSTWNVIEVIRQTLSGHSYFAHTGLSTTYNEFSALSGKTKLEGVDHLYNLDTLLTRGCAVKTLEEILDIHVIQQVWGVVTVNVVTEAEMASVYR
ncbi:fatty-acyl coenzyme A oxidase [Dissophora ornata]|nr:fatty-acyl coenzyme A oxidase [Dissophora ornata]